QPRTRRAHPPQGARRLHRAREARELRRAPGKHPARPARRPDGPPGRDAPRMTEMTNGSSRLNDSGLSDSARSGLDRITWAGRSMPVLRTISERIVERGALRGKRVGISLVLEPKTANLALALQRAGADVRVHCWASSTDDDVAEALRSRDIPVFARRGADDAEDLELARDFLRTGLDIVIDDGASIIRLAHR